MAQISVTGVATLILDSGYVSSANGPCNFWLYNGGSTTVYLDGVQGTGGSTAVLTSSTGFGLTAGSTIYGHIGAGDAIYGITAGSTVTVHRMRLFS